MPAEEMTISELQDRIWRQLPLLRRNLIGRERFDDLVIVAIEQSPIEFVRHITRGENSEDVLIAAWGQSVKRGYYLMHGSTDEKAFGPIFWILIGPLLQVLLKKILEWWFESSKNKVLLAGWRRRLTGD